MLFSNNLDLLIYFCILSNYKTVCLSKPIHFVNPVNDDELSLVLGGLTLSDLNTLDKLIDDSYSNSKAEDANGNIPLYEFDEDPSSIYMDDLKRVKREYIPEEMHEEHQVVDEEYLKLLENSFPHDDEQHDRDYDEDREDEHIRVKRQ